MKLIDKNDIDHYLRLKPGEFKKATHYALIPSTNPAYPGDKGWDDVIYLVDPLVDSSGGNRMPEYVYIMVNRSIPNMIKIGMTTRTVDERAIEISRATGVPTPWVPVYSFKCFASGILEKRVHERLIAYRVSEDREMFHITSTMAQQVIEELGKDFTNYLLVEKIEQFHSQHSPSQ